jgi:excisionase family DNA binding protein
MEARDQTVTYPKTSQTMFLSAAAIPKRRLLRIKDASEYLSLSPWKLRQLIQCGKLPVVQDTDGSPFLLDLRDLDGFVERSKRTSPL